MKQFFITGTDTDVGKTFVSVALLKCAKNKGLSTLALKPVAAGCDLRKEGLVNGDALALKAAMTQPLFYQEVNPIALEPAIAPHIAAEQAGISLKASVLAESCRSTLQKPHDFALVEGAGGWRVPLNTSETLADLAKLLAIPVILVVGMRLGCINHALLSVEAIQRDGLELAGWVANQIDGNMDVENANLAYLERAIPAPLLGHIPFLSKTPANHAAEFLDIGKILQS